MSQTITGSGEAVSVRAPMAACRPALPEEAAHPQRTAIIDLDAISENVAALRSVARSDDLMAVVKADGYSHGLVQAARAALAGGATFLGAAVLEEAFALREAGIDAPVFAWLASPGAPYAEAIRRDIQLAAYSTDQLADIARAAADAGRPARLHLKVDTGMWRGGAAPADWPELVRTARRAEQDGLVEVVGVWSHLACADEPGHPSIAAQLAVFDEAVAVARAAGLRPRYRHIANSAATLSLPESHFDLVRPGISVYGINPLPPEARDGLPRLRPAMTLAASVVQTKRAPAGSGISYGHTQRTERETTLAVVPLGYADGVFRSASSAGPVQLGGSRYRVAGRVCMDQFVVDVGDDEVAAGDRVVLFGDGDAPTAEEWAVAAGTIPYEVLTRIGPRVPRTYIGGAAAGPAASGT
ncbi:alanine racemase [Arthrobacter crystallopoietes BAB-32]|uniref:Alanine racemase n=1 Tax=Arthrobacter crystallopoietes BAB-32 TaxID=1246476 RepID=N1V7Z1_9MICC|nr:alanine racemase [Arthrobacter crystallopoietes]EMY36124.1 alanine racemase [Arthrobacter crystallopoietes BAB-32]